MKQTIDQVDVQGKRVLMRVDFNVPLIDGKVTDDRRIKTAIPSIQSVLSRGGSLTLISHLGRPSGTGFEEEFSLTPVATILSELLGKPVVCSDDDSSSKIVLKENLRFNAGEKGRDESFAKSLAEGCDMYCNEAFGTAHRNHASLVTVPKVMEGKPKVAGLLLAKELQFLDFAISNAQHPFVAVLGGAKVSDKMEAIQHLLGKVDTLIIGGAMAYTFLVASEIGVGDSIVETKRINEARQMLANATQSSTRIMLPVDHVCAQSIDANAPTKINEPSIESGWMGVDIGPKTIQQYVDILLKAKTIVWNGPMGVFELAPFRNGTEAIAIAIAKATKNGATSIVGGGETAAAISTFGLDDKMSHISTGGGASLQMLEGKAFLSVTMLDDTV